MDTRTAVKTIRKRPMSKAMETAFKTEGYEKELEAVYRRTAELLAENSDVSKALHAHLEQILPCIAFYEGLLRIMGEKEKALDFFDKHAFTQIESMALTLRKFVGFAGMYKKIPDMGDKLLDNFFGPEAGFESRGVPDAPKFARDMTACPYFETCKRYGCPEITRFFCKSDDITYGNLHPKLVWGRTQTLGTGGECCDFRLYIKQD